MTLTYGQKKALKRMKVRLFRTDLREFDRERLKKEFSTRSGKRIVKARLIRCIVYQAAVWMQRGKVPKVDGNLRSLFYQWVKPVMARVPGGLGTKFDPYAEMLDTLEVFIGELGLFRYRDLEIIDGDWQNRFYSKGKNPHVVVFAEKDGFIRFLKEVNQTYDVTTVALGGSPSHVSTEYLVEGLRNRFGADFGSVVLFGITDYDPSGFFIQEAFKRQLEGHGFEIRASFSLIAPEHYTEKEKTIFSFEVPSYYQTRLETWMKETGGIDGWPFGLEADSMPKSKLRTLLRGQLKPWLRN
jgi:hypothetical protein